MTNQIEITLDVAKKVLAVVDAGLVRGVGVAEPGKMCVEAAVCYALDLPHGDNPSCVAPALRSLKIRLNDSSWSSTEARTKGLRRLALAQLGSAGFLDESEFINRVCGLVIRKVVPGALRAAASVIKNEKHKEAMIASAAACEAFSSEKSPREARPILIKAKKDADAAYAYAAYAYAADAAAYAADAAYAAYAYAAAAAAAAAAAYAADAACANAKVKSVARDKLLASFCEDVVQILISMNAPGCQWLDLTVAEGR